MDLKEAVAKVKIAAEGANSSFHAGRHDDAEKYLCETAKQINKYFGVPPTSLEDVLSSATSEKPAETLEETQAKVSGPGVQPAVIDPEPSQGPVLPASQFGKPNQ